MKTQLRSVLKLILILLAGSGTAANASQAYGSVNNFDCVNDTGTECHGFEIELDDIGTANITYTYDYNHYGVPQISQQSQQDISSVWHTNTFVRYAAVWTNTGWSAYTAIPSGPIAPTAGHAFTNPNTNFGGEHFGVGYTLPPSKIYYHWLTNDVGPGLNLGPQVTVSTPTFTGSAGVAPQVQAVVPAPVLPPVYEFSDAVWVKVIATMSHTNSPIALRDLQTPDTNNPNAKDWRNGEADQVETEWQLLQIDYNSANFNPTNGVGGKNGQLAGATNSLGQSDDVVTYRYEYYAYVGPYDDLSEPPTHEALCETPAANGTNGTGTYSNTVVVGNFLGAQMSAVAIVSPLNLIDHLPDGQIGTVYPTRSIVIANDTNFTVTTSGGLPNGLTFDPATGRIYGSPLASGIFRFTVTAAASNSPAQTKNYPFAIAAAGEALPPHSAVDTSVFPTNAGTASGDGIYTNGTTTTVIANPNPGGVFLNWTDNGAIVSTTTNYTFTNLISRTLVANFSLGPVATTILLTNLTQVYDGTAKSVTLIVDPTNPAVNVTYNGSANAPTNMGSYTVIATISDPNYVGGATNTLTIVPLLINSQPPAMTLVVGQSTNLSVSATGVGLGYQWLKTGGRLTGQTNSTLALNNVTTNNAGNYSVIVKNNFGAVTSAVVTVTVLVPPAWATNLANKSVVLGGNVTLQVTATGTAPLAYQWWKDSSALPDATNRSYIITGAQTNDAGVYSVVVTNSVGSITSSNGVLTVLRPPTISAQPLGMTTAAGSPVTLSVAAAGTAPLTYRWLKNNAALAGATNATLTFNPAATNNSGTYTVIVTNVAGSITSSNAAVLVYIATNQLTVVINGQGSVTPNYNNNWLAVGKSYLMTAKAAKGFAFTNWEDGLGHRLTNGTALKFVMSSNLTLVANFNDVTPPTNVITAPLNGQRWSNGVFNVTGTAKDNVAVANVWYQINTGGWLAATGTASWSAAVNLTPGTNTLSAYAVDTSGNRSKTNTVKFVYVTADLAPASLNGLLATITPNGQATFHVACWTNTFSQFSYDTNNDSAVGSYVYTKLGTNTARLAPTYTAPPQFAGGSNSIFLTFTTNNVGTFSNELNNADTGLITLAPQANLVPANFTGRKFMLIGSAGEAATASFTSATAVTLTNHQGKVSTGTYAVKQNSPVGALLKVLETAKTNYLLVTFAATNYGGYTISTYHTNGFDYDLGVFAALSTAAAPGSLAATAARQWDAGVLNKWSFDSTRFSKIAPDTNELNGVGGYTYTNLGGNTAQLNIGFAAPPTLTNINAGAYLTFISPNFCIFTNQDYAGSNYLGAMSFAPAASIVPGTLAGLTITSATANGVADVVVFANDGTFSQDETGSFSPGHSTGNYTFDPYGPEGALLELDFTGGVVADSTSYVELYFDTKAPGLFYVNTFDGLGNFSDQGFGRFNAR